MPGPKETVSDPWFAAGAAAAPILRARELRVAWERFLTSDDDGDDDGGHMIRSPIADSWRRSLAAGVSPTGGSLAPVMADEDETFERWCAHPLGRVAPLIGECVSAIADEGGYLVVVSDRNGVLLRILGDHAIRRRAAEAMNFAEGTLWSEPGAGTNAIGTALAADHAVQVFGPEHLSECVHRWVCSAAPIHDPDTGEILGVIDFTSDYSTVHPHTLGVATATAQAVESALRLRLELEDALLRARYEHEVGRSAGARVLVTLTGRPLTTTPPAWGAVDRLAVPPGGGRVVLPSGVEAVAEPVSPASDAYLVEAQTRAVRRHRPLLVLRVLGRDRAHVEVDGVPVDLRPRLAEILTLLVTGAGDRDPGTLCADLHGDAGSPGSVRVEVSRLRKALRPCIDPDHYRLACDVDSDVRRVEALLRAGAVREAAAAYHGPVLPRSDAPGIVRAREHLEGWLRQAVMTADDPEALWAWVSSGGADDLGAWKRLLVMIDFQDPRRSLCAARLKELRRAWAR